MKKPKNSSHHRTFLFAWIFIKISHIKIFVFANHTQKFHLIEIKNEILWLKSKTNWIFFGEKNENEKRALKKFSRIKVT